MNTRHDIMSMNGNAAAPHQTSPGNGGVFPMDGPSPADGVVDAVETVNILIVDDEPKNLVVLETVLSDPAYRLVRAESADQALLALLADEFALLI